ncbi:MAG: hypothetical protein GX595_17465 [Lentisphaerae bacterium]|nr:hypothetical protein [Lentisphaerota bacterium]
MFSQLLSQIREALAALASGDLQAASALVQAILSAEVPEDDPNAGEIAAIKETASAAAEALAAGDSATAKKTLQSHQVQSESFEDDRPPTRPLPDDAEPAPVPGQKSPKQTHHSADLSQPSEKGRLWEVTIIKAGRASNGDLYTPEVLRRSVHLFEGCRVYDNHLTNEEFFANPNRRVGDLLGWISGVHWDQSSQSLRGMFHCAASWLRHLLWNLHQESATIIPGLSVDIFVTYDKPRTVEGRTLKPVLEIAKVNSVDMVHFPGAGGSVDRMVAAKQAEDAPTAAKHAERKSAARQAEDAPAAAKHTEDPAPAAQHPAPGNSPDAAIRSESRARAPIADSSRLQELELRLYRHDLRATLAESELPKQARDFLYREFSDHQVPPERIERAIADQRTLINSLAPEARVTNAGSVRGVGPVSEVSDFARDFESLVGWGERPYKGRFRRLSDWYVALTGDQKFRGTLDPERTTQANVTTLTMANICADALNKQMIALWEGAPRWWDPLVTYYDTPLYQEVKATRVEEIANLATVIEGNAYVEAVWGDTRETAEFLKKGNYIGITLESIMADDVEQMKLLPEVLSRSWLNTLGTLVSNVFTANGGTGPLMSDANQLFDAVNHINLGVDALDYTSWCAAAAAIMGQVLPGSGRKLGVPPAFLLVPTELYNTARAIEISELGPSMVPVPNEFNVWRNLFQTVLVPDWADANNWAAMADPKRAPSIGLHFLQGQQTPELFTADSPTGGAMFTNDELRIKIRGWVACSVADHRPLFKANVP